MRDKYYISSLSKPTPTHFCQWNHWEEITMVKQIFVIFWIRKSQTREITPLSHDWDLKLWRIQARDPMYNCPYNFIRASITTDCMAARHLQMRGWLMSANPSTTMLTQLLLDKMAAISQTTYLNAFPGMESSVFWFEFHWSLFQRVRLTKSQHWFRQWLGADQATSHYLNQCWSSSLTHICAAQGWEELTEL